MRSIYYSSCFYEIITKYYTEFRLVNKRKAKPKSNEVSNKSFMTSTTFLRKTPEC